MIRKPQQDLLDDGPAMDERVAEIALDDASEPPEILLQERAVETEFVENLEPHLGIVRDGDPHHLGHDVARE